MAETVTVNGTEVEVRETEDGFEAVERESFTTYLRQNVFTSGRYVFEPSDSGRFVEVAEHDDGMGMIMEQDVQRAISDSNVSIVCIDNGWLVLENDR